MKKEEMINNISGMIDIIETALNEIENRIDYSVLNDKIAALGNFKESELPMVGKLTQYVVNNSDEFRSKRGKGGGVIRNSYIQDKINEKAAARKTKVVSAARAEVEKSLESKMITGEAIQKFPLDADEPEEINNDE